MRSTPFLLVLALASPALAQSTWYVDSSVPGPGTGTRADPHASIQYGIDQPTTLGGGTLLVAFGNYVEPIDFAGKLIGGGILIRAASPILDDVLVGHCQADRGGGIAIIEGAAPDFHEVTVRRSLSNLAGGVWVHAFLHPRPEP